ncbi:unnamed protein product [Parajaminaea phylloscopi]
MKIVHRASQSGALQRFNALVNEYRILQSIDRNTTTWNENVVRFEDFLLTPTYACLVMPYYEVQMTVCLPFAACRVYFTKMAIALGWLHDNYVTHNDIKLANTLVRHCPGDRYGQPVLVDFGFARCHAPNKGTNFLSTESWGTPEYLSPERMVGDVHDERLSDLWSLGVSFFEMATGRTPFEKKDETFTTPELREEYYRRTVQGHWYSDYDLPFEVEDLCRSIVHLVPSKRLRISEMLQHQFFHSAREGHVDGVGEIHLKTGWQSDTELSEETCTKALGAKSLSPSPSEADIEETCLRAGRRLEFLETSPVPEEDTSTVPFPSSPSLENFEASFDSELCQAELPWTKFSSSGAAETVLGQLQFETPGSPDVGAATASEEASSQLLVTGHPVATLRRGQDSDIVRSSSSGRKGTVGVDSGTPAKGVTAIPSLRSLQRRPGAPTPSRFRSTVAEPEIATPLVTARNMGHCKQASVTSLTGRSPVRYLGSLGDRQSQRSLLPLPTRLGSVRAVATSDPLHPPLSLTRSNRHAGSQTPVRNPAQCVTPACTAPPRYGSIVEVLDDSQSLFLSDEDTVASPSGLSAPPVAEAAREAQENHAGCLAPVLLANVAPRPAFIDASTMTTPAEQTVATALWTTTHVTELTVRLERMSILTSELTQLMAECSAHLATNAHYLENTPRLTGQAFPETSRSALVSAGGSESVTRSFNTPTRSASRQASHQAQRREYVEVGVHTTAADLLPEGTTASTQPDPSEAIYEAPSAAREETLSRRATVDLHYYQGLLQHSSPRRKPVPPASTVFDTPRAAKRKEEGFQMILKDHGVEKRGRGLQGQQAATPIEEDFDRPASAFSAVMTPRSVSMASKVLRRVKANAALHRRDSALRAGSRNSMQSEVYSPSKTTESSHAHTDTHTPSRVSMERLLRHRRSRSALGVADAPASVSSNVGEKVGRFNLGSIDLDRSKPVHIGEAPRHYYPVTPGATPALPLWKKLRGAVKEVSQRTV